MREIVLRGKYAAGQAAVALVDDSDFDRLNAFAWKAKPGGGGHVYAMRNTVRDGRNVSVRMHREVLGYAGDLDVRFWNGNRLDNRRANLVITRRSSTLSNPECPSKRGHGVRPQRQIVVREKPVKQLARAACKGCGVEFEQARSDQVFCSERCRFLWSHPTLAPVTCMVCTVRFKPRVRRQITCSSACKQAHARSIAKHQGTSAASHSTGAKRLEAELVHGLGLGERLGEQGNAK